jgi:hypothetical protein
MSSYNENLQASVLASLQALELDQKNMKSKLDASTFTLYYAEGAVITAAEKLQLANQDYTAKQTVQNQAVNCNNISTNLLAAANEQKKYIGQSVTNAAVAASNVQIAANAVLRLSSDMGSIFSILSAADYGTDIYQQGLEAYNLMTETAYAAEYTSQLAMEASTLTAEVSSGTVADMAKSTNDSVTGILKVASSEFDSQASVVGADNDALAQASAAEKVAEGVMEYTNAEYKATNQAYMLNNKELNLNLVVPKKMQSAIKYTVSFNTYQAPFPNSSTHAGYPVSSYYIMLVKSSKQTVFNMANAEGLLLYTDRVMAIPSPADKSVISRDIFISDLKDSDGDSMQLGQEYVVFVFTTFTEEYKKAINDFDDYLTAPSAPFTLTNTLNAPIAGKHNVLVEESGKKQTLHFKLTENREFKVEYRAMFLPDVKSLAAGLLTEAGLRTIEKEVERMEQIADKYDPMIAEVQAEITSLNSTLDALTAQIKVVNAELKKATNEKQRKKLHDELEDLNEQQAQTQVSLTQANDTLKQLEKEKKLAMKSIEVDYPSQIGFFFNLKIAEQISAGNYTVATAHVHPLKGSNKAEIVGEAQLKPETTDVFGNRLVEGNSYYPVVLSVSTALEENLDQFTNALSDYNKALSFVYGNKK